MPKQAKSFVQTQTWARGPQLLQVVHEGSRYNIHILHASIDELRRQISRRSRGHVHDVYHIVLYTRGEGHFRLNDKLHPFARGTLVLSGPGDMHDFGAVDCRASYSEVSFEFRETETGETLPLPFPILLERIIGCPVEDFVSPRQLDAQTASTINDLLINLVGYLRNSSGFGPFHTCVCLARVLALCADVCMSPAGRGSPHMRTPMDEIADHIQSNYTRPLTVDDLSERAAMSRGHFLRQFKAQFGISPIAYQLHLRMEAAKVLLKTTSLRCHEVAARVGYDDVYHFSRSFKKAVGTSPTAFRRR